LVNFGRSAYYQATRTKTKTATFDFLGFTHRTATSRAGKFAMQVSTMKKRLRRGLLAIAAWCREHLHTPLESQQQTLNVKLARPLPVLRPSDELSQSGEVRPRGAPHMASVAGTQDAGKVPPLAALQSYPCALSLIAPAHHARLASFVSRA
jgi:hypothetical protein